MGEPLPRAAIPDRGRWARIARTGQPTQRHMGCAETKPTPPCAVLQQSSTIIPCIVPARLAAHDATVAEPACLELLQALSCFTHTGMPDVTRATCIHSIHSNKQYELSGVCLATHCARRSTQNHSGPTCTQQGSPTQACSLQHSTPTATLRDQNMLGLRALSDAAATAAAAARSWHARANEVAGPNIAQNRHAHTQHPEESSLAPCKNTRMQITRTPAHCQTEGPTPGPSHKPLGRGCWIQSRSAARCTNCRGKAHIAGPPSQHGAPTLAGRMSVQVTRESVCGWDVLRHATRTMSKAVLALKTVRIGLPGEQTSPQPCASRCQARRTGGAPQMLWLGPLNKSVQNCPSAKPQPASRLPDASCVHVHRA